MYYKAVLLRLGIFLSGGAIGFLIGKKIYEEYYAKIAQEEIDSVKETFEKHKALDWEYASERKLGEVTQINENDDGIEFVAKKDNRTNNNPLSRSSLTDGNPYEQAKKNYNLPGIQHEEPFTDEAGKTEEDMEIPEVDRTQPYIIDDEEFSSGFDHHDKISLYYYKEDDVLCDEHEEVIDSIEESVGYEAISMLDTQNSVWVRNEPLCIDYEIISINNSYASLVHGIGLETNLTPREKYLRREKRRDRRED